MYRSVAITTEAPKGVKLTAKGAQELVRQGAEAAVAEVDYRAVKNQFNGEGRVTVTLEVVLEIEE